MMFERKIVKSLEAWAERKGRKPLIIRGARQVGKTSAVKLFARQFDHFLYFNLDRNEDKEIFGRAENFGQLVDALFFVKKTAKSAGRTLLFIDEIQNSEEAVRSLRYFFEDRPDLFVIAAGSMLESLLVKGISFPVGRVEYMAMHPCSFSEYLNACGEQETEMYLHHDEVPFYVHEKLLAHFHRFMMIGGMPEIVQRYAETGDLSLLTPVYEGLITAFLDDVEKYARPSGQAGVIRYIIAQAFRYAGLRITFEGFGNSNFHSREMGEAFRILERTMLLQLIYPAINATLPPLVKHRSPKLQLLDTGLVNYQSGNQGELMLSDDLITFYGGRIAEHMVGQELLARGTTLVPQLNYWIRDRKTSQAEVDYVIPHKGLMLPVEVKSGSSGKLRSLHQFIDEAAHNYGIRLYAGTLRKEEVRTLAGKPYHLISIPLYMAGNIEEVLDRMVK